MTLRVKVQVPVSPSASVSVPDTAYEFTANEAPTTEIAPVLETATLGFGLVTAKTIALPSWVKGSSWLVKPEV